jgi:signal transduction histidine kinase
MLCVFVDCSERHEAEDELRDLGGRLIAAHEQERIRLARELHDDLAQRVAFVSTGLDLFRQRLSNAPPGAEDDVATLASAITDIGSELHRVSHELHPARLELLGLEASIRSFCKALAHTHAITVRVDIDAVPRTLGPEADLCLYRITQEALHNVQRHSGATHATVTLNQVGDDIILSIRDDGVGFEPQKIRSKGTLGLVSMRERARLVRGQLLMSSQPGAGTRIEARVPIGRA